MAKHTKLEVMEENWRNETSSLVEASSKDLNSLVTKQQENECLNSILSEKEKLSPNDCKDELAAVQTSKELTEQHRGQLVIKDEELLARANELEKGSCLQDHCLCDNVCGDKGIYIKTEASAADLQREDSGHFHLHSTDKEIADKDPDVHNISDEEPNFKEVLTENKMSSASKNNVLDASNCMSSQSEELNIQYHQSSRDNGEQEDIYIIKNLGEVEGEDETHISFSPTEASHSSRVCEFHLRGQCRFATKCRYKHLIYYDVPPLISAEEEMFAASTQEHSQEQMDWCKKAQDETISYTNDFRKHFSDLALKFSCILDEKNKSEDIQHVPTGKSYARSRLIKFKASDKCKESYSTQEFNEQNISKFSDDSKLGNEPLPSSGTDASGFESQGNTDIKHHTSPLSLGLHFSFTDLIEDLPEREGKRFQ